MKNIKVFLVFSFCVISCALFAEPIQSSSPCACKSCQCTMEKNCGCMTGQKCSCSEKCECMQKHE